MMKRKDFTGDLKKMLAEKRLAAAKLKVSLSAGKEKNLRAYKNLRREIAQILTLEREKQILESLKK